MSTLEPGGIPGIVDRVKVAPPRSRIGAITPEQRQQALSLSPVGRKYDERVDRDSAYELLQGRATTTIEDATPHPPWGTGLAPRKESTNPWGMAPSEPSRPAAARPAQAAAPRRRTVRQPEEPAGMGGLLGDILTGGGGRRQGVAEALAKSVVRSVGGQVGRQVGTAIVRGVLGSILKR
jgi:hypothetical protein